MRYSSVRSIAPRVAVALATALGVFSAAWSQEQTTPTTTTVTVAPATPTISQAVTLTVAVSPSDACSGDGLGGTLYYGTGSGPNSSDQKSIYNSDPCFAQPLGTLPAGSYYAFAQYNGSETHKLNGSTSPIINFTVTAPGGTNGAALLGPYAFILQGTAGSGAKTTPAALMGTFFADGQGNLNSGSVDMATLAGTQQSIEAAGTYTLDTSGRGSFSLTGANGTVNFSFTTGAGLTSVHSALLTAGGSVYGSGQLLQQPIEGRPLNGQYQVTLTGGVGITATQPFTATGSITFPGPHSSSTIFGVIDETFGTSNFIQGVSFTGNLSYVGGLSETIAVNTLKVDGASPPPGFPLTFDFIPVDATHFFIIDTEPLPANPTPTQQQFYPVISGIAVQQ